MPSQINIIGLEMAIICLAIIIVQFAVHKFVKKVTNTYWFWLGVGLFVFIWLLVFRFVPDWKEYASKAGELNGAEKGDAVTISRAFLLDICPFMGLFMPFALIVDPTRKLAKAAAPLALIGGLLIVFIQMPGESASGSTSPIWDAHWIFMGDGVNRCYFIMHAFNMFLSIGVMLNTPRYEAKGYFSCVAVAAIYYSYVAIAMHCLNCQWMVSGLNINDWSSYGEYFIVAQDILHCSPQLAAGLTFPLCFLICSGFMALKDFVFNKWVWKYGDIYSGKWYAWYNYNKFKKFEIGNQSKVINTKHLEITII